MESEVELKGLLTLALTDRISIYLFIRKLREDAHKHYRDFGLFSTNTEILNRLIDIVRTYEMNDLQLNGHSVWLLSHLASRSQNQDSSPDTIAYFSNRSILDTLIRLSLEQPVYSYCHNLFNQLIDNNQELFQILCKIGET